MKNLYNEASIVIEALEAHQEGARRRLTLELENIEEMKATLNLSANRVSEMRDAIESFERAIKALSGDHL